MSLLARQGNGDPLPRQALDRLRACSGVVEYLQTFCRLVVDDPAEPHLESPPPPGAARGGALRKALTDLFREQAPAALALLPGYALQAVREAITSREPRGDVARRAARAALLWGLFRPTTTPDGCDQYGRWWPLTGRADDAAADRPPARDYSLDLPADHPAKGDLETLLRVLAVLGECSRFAVEVTFPVALQPPGGGPAETGLILQAAVTRLDRAGCGGLPPVVLAPWSPLLLAARGARSSSGQEVGWLAKLHDQLSQLAAGAPEELRETFGADRFMLEINPAPVRNPRNRTVVDPVRFEVKGDSLGLAVLLAAYAGSRDRQRPLADLIVTGAIGPDRVEKVDDVKAKLRAACLYVEEKTVPPCLFLYPEACDVSSEKPHGGLKLEAVGSWESLLRDEDRLLGDNFQDYRESIAGRLPTAAGLLRRCTDSGVEGGFLPEEVASLDETVGAAYAAAGGDGDDVFRAGIPFDEDPLSVARYVAIHLTHRLRDDPRAARSPVPLLFPLVSPPSDAKFGLRPGGTESGLSLFERMQSWLGEGLSEWGWDEAVREKLSRPIGNLVREWRRKQLLIVYANRSTVADYSDGSEQRARLTALREYVSGSPAHNRPRLLLVPSDLHHRLWMNELLGLNDPEFPVTRGTR
jgi:hypothetical protein